MWLWLKAWLKMTESGKLTFYSLPTINRFDLYGLDKFERFWQFGQRYAPDIVRSAPTRHTNKMHIIIVDELGKCNIFTAFYGLLETHFVISYRNVNSLWLNIRHQSNNIPQSRVVNANMCLQCQLCDFSFDNQNWQYMRNSTGKYGLSSWKYRVCLNYTATTYRYSLVWQKFITCDEEHTEQGAA